MSLFRFRDKDTAENILGLIKKMDLNIRLMHVCGTHQDTLIRHGLDSLIKDCGIHIHQGPGCPVCVTTVREYEKAITLAKNGVIITTFGDASRVPGQHKSLLDLRAEGSYIRIVYSIEDAVKISERTEKEVVFLGVGFETTAPSTAIKILQGLPNNFSILCCHRYIPPVLDKLLDMGEFKIDGLIQPGHVSTIIGIKPYEKILKKFDIPQVIAGFEPLDMLMAVYMLARQIRKGEAKVENEYFRVVRHVGNVKALKALNSVFQPNNIDWRGFPTINKSGMKIRKKYEDYDAEKKFEDILEELDSKIFGEREGCMCGEVLRGITESEDCPLFGTRCKPKQPVGPCMISVEGSCNIQYKYRNQ